MDPRIGVDRQPAMPPRIASGKPLGAQDTGVAVADDRRGWQETRVHPRESGSHISPDPMRSTDRYRLVIPYAPRV